MTMSERQSALNMTYFEKLPKFLQFYPYFIIPIDGIKIKCCFIFLLF